MNEHLTFDQLPKAVAMLIKEVSELKRLFLEKQEQANEAEVQADIFGEYIRKTEVRGKLASSSTLWSWENKGKLKLYAIGGKRFYKRSDIEALFTEVKKEGVYNQLL